jgi:hypothetical protein
MQPIFNHTVFAMQRQYRKEGTLNKTRLQRGFMAAIKNGESLGTRNNHQYYGEGV